MAGEGNGHQSADEQERGRSHTLYVVNSHTFHWKGRPKDIWIMVQWFHRKEDLTSERYVTQVTLSDFGSSYTICFQLSQTSCIQ